MVDRAHRGARRGVRDVLDPILLFAELLRGYDESRMDFNMAEIGAVIRLLALGGLAQTLTHGGFDYMYSDCLKTSLREFDEACKEHQGGAS